MRVWSRVACGAESRCESSKQGQASNAKPTRGEAEAVVLVCPPYVLDSYIFPIFK